MANEKRKVGGIRDLNKRGKKLYVILRRAGGTDEAGRLKFVDVELPLDHALTASEREQIDAMWPDPAPPRQINQVTGVPFLDTTDEAWRKSVNETLPAKRRDARVCRMLGKEQLGVRGTNTKDELEEAIVIIRNIEGIGPEDLESIDYQGRNASEVSEEGVAAAEQALSPM